MSLTTPHDTVGLLLSGGLDSSILLGHLLAQGCRVQPFYVRSDVVWQQQELAAIENFSGTLPQSSLAPLKTFDLPLADLYADHWSLTGRNTPDAASPDEAVFLPGRNALLILKPALWCQLNGIGRLALAPLGTSPFDDARPEFFDELARTLGRLGLPPIAISRPFASMNKRQVMELGRGLELHWTFSCIAPRSGLHCGKCNKCAERRTAFAEASLHDKTRYADDGKL